MKKKGTFIVFEGGEGSGKSGQAKLLAQHLRSQGHPVVLTREPGGTPNIGTDIRNVLLDPRHHETMLPRTELLLFLADRTDHVERVIRPALEEGNIVICDRFTASTFAYQCFTGEACTPSEFMEMEKFARGGLTPDFTFWIDIDPRIGLERNRVNGKRDRFEGKDLSFHEKVREGFKAYFDLYKDRHRFARIDGGPPIAEVQVQIKTRADHLVA